MARAPPGIIRPGGGGGQGPLERFFRPFRGLGSSCGAWVTGAEQTQHVRVVAPRSVRTRYTRNQFILYLAYYHIALPHSVAKRGIRVADRRSRVLQTTR